MTDKKNQSKDYLNESVKKDITTNTSDPKTDNPPNFTSGDGEEVDTTSSEDNQD